MRRTILLIATAAAVLALASGVALAASIQGDGGDNRLVGTDGTDNISGGGNDDAIFGRGARDRLNGDTGADTLKGGGGNDDLFGGNGDDDMFANGGDDYVNAADKRPGEAVDCGPGEDEAVVDGVTEFEGGDEPTIIFASPTDDPVGCERLFVVAPGFPGSFVLDQGGMPEPVEEGDLVEAQ